MDMCFIANGEIYHCATNGALIPEALRDIPLFNSIKSHLWNLETIVDRDNLTFNRQHIEGIVTSQRRIIDRYNRQENEEGQNLRIDISDDLIEENYLSSFIEMALRGARSHDHMETSYDSRSVVKETFVFVAGPKQDVDVQPVLQSFQDAHIEIPDISDIVEISDNYITITVNRRQVR